MSKKVTVSIKIVNENNGTIFRTTTEEKSAGENEETLLAFAILRSLREQTTDFENFCLEDFLTVFLTTSKIKAFADLGEIWDFQSYQNFDDHVTIVEK